MRYNNILLVEDDEDDQEIFLAALRKVDGSINCVPLFSAKEALDNLHSKKIESDLIFLDLNMPGMNGQQFLTEIKKNDTLRHIPVIVLSTSSHTSMIREARELGAQDFFSKPDKFEDLVSILLSVLGH
jgi:CheY-like chemotaxis protein